MLSYLQDEHKVDAATSPQAMARIERAAELAKIVLSDRPYAGIEEEYLLEDDAGRPVNLSLELARDAYEAMIGDYVDKHLGCSAHGFGWRQPDRLRPG